MRRISFFIASFLLPVGLLLAAPVADSYRFTLDLVNVSDDKIRVTLQTPTLTQDEVIYNIPKMVPGTYSVDNFGRYLLDFKAYDAKGNLLAVEKIDDNRWKIQNARALTKITYQADDSFQDATAAHQVFEPAGTNIEVNQHFLINTHGFMGYFNGLKRLPYELTVLKPRNFYGSTALRATKTSPTADTYRVPSYMELVDSPLMYNIPDTTTLRVGGADVLVSVYAPSRKVKAAYIGATIRETLEAQKNYLGGRLPVDKYAFLIYLADKPNKTGSYGALEHSYSSVYYLPEAEPEQIARELVSIAAHEFFHVVTPLSIHAEQIHDFDYNNPTMSQHLWLYEGVTEYAATHVQVNQKLQTPEAYLNTLHNYLTGADNYNDTLPFTELSKGALDRYADQYNNVYQKGALIGLALDIKLRELSGGTYGLRHLMTDLARTYGKNQAFKDEELFDQITALTYPAIREFFRQHVEGRQPLPYAALFKTVGILYRPVITEPRMTMGNIELGYDETTQKLTVGNTAAMNAFGKKMGFRSGDQLVAINQKPITPQSAPALFQSEVYDRRAGDKITVTINRKNKRGKIKTKQLKGRLTQVTSEKRHVLTFDPQATPPQKILQNAWLYGN